MSEKKLNQFNIGFRTGPNMTFNVPAKDTEKVLRDLRGRWHRYLTIKTNKSTVFIRKKDIVCAAVNPVEDLLRQTRGN